MTKHNLHRIASLVLASSLAGSPATPLVAQEAPPAAAPQPAAPAPAQPPAPAPAAATAPAAAPALEEEDAPQLVQAVGNDTKIDAIVAMINEQIDNKIVLYGKVAGTPVSILADNVPVTDVLNQLSSKNNWVWWREDNGDYGLSDKEYYEKEILPRKVVQRVFRPNNIKASELERAIKGLMTPNVGASVADDRTNKLIVNDLPQALERIERFIREIDVQLIVRLFYIRHADVEDIAKKIEAYKSGPGTIEVDVKTHQIIVTDLLSNIKKMELLIDILDVGPEIVIYDVNNIGIEGEDLEALQKIIDTIRTKDLLFEVNDKQGVMILEDVPEVHERVEQILSEFDKPVRQVLLQGEILSTRFEKNFSFGVQNFQLAEDLSAAATAGSLFPSPTVPGGSTAVPIGGFTDIRNTFPTFSMSGNTVGGQWLSSHAFIQLQAVYSDSSTRVLLQPRLLVKNQEPSNIFVGREVPYVTTFYDDSGNNNNNFRTTSTQSTVQDGLKLEVTPSIANSYLIELELKIDNDAAFEVEEASLEGRRLIGRNRQNVETTLQIPSGRTRIIGGLISHENGDASSGLPFLSSLPWIGALFGQKSTSEETTNLMLFITPTVVEEDEVRTNEGGRRGRSVSTDERVAGQYDLQLGTEDPSAVEDPLAGLPEGLLSGDAEEEEEALRRIREIEEKKRLELEEGEGNYTPQMGVGSTTLNAPSIPGGPGAGAPPAPPPQSGTNLPPHMRPSQPTNLSPQGESLPPPPPPAETRY